jgi:hypothetical protein
MGVMAIYFLLVAYATYRSKDFVTATETSNFATKGTCVESVTDDIVADADFMDASWDCANEHEKLARLLLSQTHSVYYLHKTAPSAEVTGVAFALMASTIGSTSQSINTSMAYNVLRMLDDEGFTVPKDCSSIYTEAEPMAYDTLDQILPAISCGATLNGSNPGSFDGDEWDKLLYACNKQFYFGSSGPHMDTYGIPLLNEPPGPNVYRWPNTTGFNETSAWSVKSRMFLGFRFGWSLWAYVPSMLALAYLTMDAALVLLVEITIKARSDGIIKNSEGDDIKDSKAQALKRFETFVATYIREREVRFVLSFLLVLNSIIWMTVAVWTPWGFGSPRLGRPVCDQGVDADVDPTWAYLFYKKTQGGWKSDAPCLFLEFVVIVTQVFMVVAIPFSQKRYNDDDDKDKSKEDKDDGNNSENNKQNRPPRWVEVMKSAKGSGIFIGATVIGIVALVAGNAFAGSTFGNAWARAVADESVPWNDKIDKVQEYIYDMNLGTLISVLSAGIVLAVVIGRWMFDTITPSDLQIFVLWAVFALGAFLPMLNVYRINYFTNKDDHIADCDIFPEGGDYDLEHNSCEARYWAVIVGTSLLGGVVILLVSIGMAEACLRGTLCKCGNRVNIRSAVRSSWLPRWLRRRRTRSSVDTKATRALVINMDRFKSDEKFFNFCTDKKSTDDAQRALLDPSPLPSSTGAQKAPAPSRMRFTLNPATIVPANKR